MYYICDKLFGLYLQTITITRHHSLFLLWYVFLSLTYVATVILRQVMDSRLKYWLVYLLTFTVTYWHTPKVKVAYLKSTNTTQVLFCVFRFWISDVLLLLFWPSVWHIKKQSLLYIMFLPDMISNSSWMI